MLLGEGVELQEYLADNAHLGAWLFLADTVKLCRRHADIAHEVVMTPLKDKPFAYLQVEVSQPCGLSRLLFAHDGSVIEFRHAVTVKQRIKGDGHQLEPVYTETGLLVLNRTAESERHNGHFAVTSIHQSLLYQRHVAARAALSARLCHGHSGFFRVILAAFKRLYDVANYERCRVAHFVVGVFQAPFARLGVAQRQVLNVVSGYLHDGGYERRDERSEVRNKDFAPPASLVECRSGIETALFMPLPATHGGELQALDERTDTQLHRADVVDVVELQQRKHLAVAHQHVANLVNKECVRAAAERCHLDKLHVILPRTPLRRLQNTVGISPLREVMGVVNGHVLATHNVVGYDINAHVRQHVRHLVLYQHVCVIRPSGQQYGQSPFLAGLAVNAFVIRNDGADVVFLRLYGKAESVGHGLAIHPKAAKILLALLQQKALVLETYGRRVNRHRP